jgi:hypothetical protein
MAVKKKKRVVKRKKAAPKKRVLKRRAGSGVSKKRPVRAKKPVVAKKPKEKGIVVGTITHYFPHVQAAVTKLKSPLAVGDTIKVKGHTTDFTQTVASIQINHVVVNSAKKGDEIGFQVVSRVRQHDVIYKI